MIKAILLVNFNFGEHYYEAVFSSVWLNVFIALASAFIGAFFGFLFSNWTAKVSIRRKMKKQVEYLKKNLDEVIDFSVQQRDEYNKVYNTQKNNLYHYHKTTNLSFKNLEYISKLNSGDLYDYFYRSMRMEWNDYSDIFLNIDHIQNIINIVANVNIDNQRQYFNNIEHIEKNRNEILINLEHRLINLKNKQITNSNEYTFIKRLIEINNQIPKIDKRHDFKRIKEELVQTLLSNLNDDYIDNSFWSEIHIQGKMIEYHIDKICVNNIASNELLLDNINQIAADLNRLKEILDLYKII